jgi:acyl carrier protein
MEASENLILKLKRQIIEELALEDFEPADIGTDESLFDEGLGLDSIDALSLVVILDKDYGIQVLDPEQGKKILYSIRTIANYIVENQS